MKYTIPEQKALKKLGIPDFKHMTKAKIVEFTSMLPKMDPEVAKAALAQFPEFSSMSREILKQFNDVTNKLMEGNTSSQDNYYQVCKEIIHSLQKELEKEDIDAAERDRIEDKMLVVAGMISEKDSENKNFLMKIFLGFGLISLLGIGAGAAALGVNSSIRKPRGHDQDDE